jgi:APA family basic amino acid/polyamine antiporter
VFEPPAAAPPPTPGAWSGGDFVRAVLPVLFSYGGWQFVTYVAPAVRDPQRTLPRAILGGMLGVVAVYLLANAAFVRVVGLSGVAADKGFAADVAHGALGEVGGALLVAAMAVSSLGVCTAILMSSPWVYVAMARDGLFFRSIGAVSERSGAPANALLLQGAVALGYFAWGRAATMTDAVVFAEWIFHAQCGLALLLLRRRRPELPRPFRSPLYPLFPALYALLATGVVVSVVAGAVQDEAQRSKALIGLGVLAAGGVAYAGWRRGGGERAG